MDRRTISSEFNWSSLGDINEGRQNLGEEMPVIIYRLYQYTMKDILIKHFDEATAKKIIKEAGFVAGTQFAKNMLDLSGDFHEFVAGLQRKMKEMKIGILRIETADLEKLSVTLTISEDLDCSGLPVTDDTVCDYDEGFIAGIFEAYSGKTFEVNEIDCWASGDRTCRFLAKANT